MKLTIVVSMFILTALGAPKWPTTSWQAHVVDARPEAVATGGALLVLASILRRNVVGRSK